MTLSSSCFILYYTRLQNYKSGFEFRDEWKYYNFEVKFIYSKPSQFYYFSLWKY